jgi:glycosyltransferase involved in cell wall biosynthesis
MKIAIYTIALNEEQFVDRWYESVKDADYILIADTGSTDNTVKKAKKLGINVVDIRISPWRFDDARNAALAAIPLDIDYCISLDMDEIITPNYREALQKMFDDDVTRPKYKHVWSWNEDGTPGLEFGYDHIHTRKNYRWRHPVHECLYPYGIEEKEGWAEGLETHHHPDPTKSRSQYLPLLKMSVTEDPHNDRNAFYYGRELYFYGQYEEAKKELIRHLSLPSAVWKPERSASMRYIAKCSYGEEREKWLIDAHRETPNKREPLVDLSTYYYENGIWDKSLEYAKKALDIKEKSLEYLCEEEAWGDKPYDLAAIASYSLGLYDDALSYGVEALKLNPNDKRLKFNLAYYSNKNINK